MKLFLSSSGLETKQLETQFLDLVDKPPAEVTLAFIANAADPYPENNREWVDNSRETLQRLGIQVEDVDLREYIDKSPELSLALEKFDVIWVCGGNTFYLRHVMRESGFDQVIRPLLEKNKVYVGESAGSIVAGPTLEKFEEADDPLKAKEVITDGLHLTETVVIPHWGGDYKPERMKEIKKFYEKSPYKFVTLTDEQALIIT